MNEIDIWFSGLATPGGMGYFLAGFISCIILYKLWCRIKHKKAFVNWRYAGIAIGIAVIAFVSLQTQAAYSLAKNTALESASCQKEFYKALGNRARITGENDEISQNQRKIIYEWIHDLIFPPPPYNTMDPNDPLRQQYGLNLTINTDRAFHESLNRQDELQNERDSHPLPEPTCGK